ncbi:MAG: C40 family peptidase [Flavobacteriales bacterium]|nr:C40 family peptidase [Flavobacteriales bacterium]
MAIDAYMHPFLGAPYLWGGRTPSGVDCSGLTQMLFMLMGIYLPRDAFQQAEEGDPVELVDLAEPGDLAFFDNAEGRITHVGIVLPERRILHASGRVRIDALDQEGIFDAEQGKYSHKLRLVKQAPAQSAVPECPRTRSLAPPLANSLQSTMSSHRRCGCACLDA